MSRIRWLRKSERVSRGAVQFVRIGAQKNIPRNGIDGRLLHRLVLDVQGRS